MTIKQIFAEVKHDYLKTKFVNVLIEGAIALIFTRILLFFIPEFIENQALYVPIGLAVAYMTIAFIHRANKYSLSFVGKRVSELDEILQTTAELNPKNDDPNESLPSKATKEELTERAAHTSTVTLFEFKKLYIKSAVLFGLVFLMLVMPYAANDINLSTLIPYEDYLPNMNFGRQDISPDNVTLLDDDGLYGEASEFANTGERIEITVDLSHSGGDYQNPLAWDNQISGDSRGSSLFADAQIENPAIEKLPEEIELAKAYNLKIQQLK